MDRSIDRGMDRPLEPAVNARRRLRRWLLIGVGLAVLTFCYAGAVRWLRPTADLKTLRLVAVERGAIEARLQASGTIEPLEERIITSPSEARLVRVIRRAGDTVEPGQPILKLDTGALALDATKLEQQWAAKRNEMQRARLASERQITDLESELQSQQLSLQFLRVKRDQAEQLHREGLASQESLLAARLEVDYADAALRRLTRSLEIARASVQAELEGMQLQLQVIAQERQLTAERLRRAAASSDVAGTLTWTLTDPGTRVHEGEVIARVSDLSRFRVRATLSDLHTTRIESGLPAKVRVDGEQLTGRVATVLPAVENGAVTLLIELDQPNHSTLRANRRVDVELVTERKSDVLIARRGPAVSGTGATELFAVSGDAALRRKVQVGLVNLDWFEVISGAEDGEQLIVSDMRTWDGHNTLALR